MAKILQAHKGELCVSAKQSRPPRRRSPNAGPHTAALLERQACSSRCSGQDQTHHRHSMHLPVRKEALTVNDATETKCTMAGGYLSNNAAFGLFTFVSTIGRAG